MTITVLIGLMIILVIGIALIPTVTTTIEAIDTTESPGIAALLSVLPYVFIVIVLVGAVAWIAPIDEAGSHIPERLKIWRHRKENVTPVDKTIEQVKEDKKTKQTTTKYKPQCKSCKNYTKVNGIPWCLHHDTTRDPFDDTCEHFT